MALETIVEEIRKKGDDQVSEIKEEANKEAERIKAEAKEEANRILENARKEAEEEAERLRRQEISGLNLEMKRELLSKKKELPELVYDKLEEKVKDMDKETKKKLLSSLVKNNASSGNVVYSSKDDEDVVKEIVSDMNGVEYAGNVDCLGGVIIESKGGEMRINLTFDEMLKQLYDEKMFDVSKILFGE